MKKNIRFKRNSCCCVVAHTFEGIMRGYEDLSHASTSLLFSHSLNLSFYLYRIRWASATTRVKARAWVFPPIVR